MDSDSFVVSEPKVQKRSYDESSNEHKTWTASFLRSAENQFWQLKNYRYKRQRAVSKKDNGTRKFLDEYKMEAYTGRIYPQYLMTL